jgi:hypothetical protein
VEVPTSQTTKTVAGFEVLEIRWARGANVFVFAPIGHGGCADQCARTRDVHYMVLLANVLKVQFLLCQSYTVVS